MDFVIRKDIYGNWWHDFNNDATKINISDFEALIDEVQNTFIIQCKNGSNVPTMGVSIVNVKVVNSIISPTPIAFSGAVGLKNLLTTLNYTPYVTAGSGSGAVDSVNGQTGVVIIPIPENTSDLVNDGSDGVNPFITAADVPDYDFQAVTDNGATTTNTVTFGDSGSGTYTEVANQGVNAYDTPNSKSAEYTSLGAYNYDSASNKTIGFNSDRILMQTSGSGVVEIKSDNVEDNYSVQFPEKTLNSVQTFAMLSDITPSAVDSVNGQTGVVVLDAVDVGAEPTKGADDNYVTDAQLVVIGNTSGTNSGDNATNTKYEVAATTGAVISFATPQVYNSIASPSSSNLTDNLTGARIGVVQKIYHNAGTAPTVPAGWVLRGTGAYVTSTLNIIYAEWSVGTTVEYWITQ